MKMILAILFATFYITTNAQSVKLIDGSLDKWSNDTVYNIIFNYDSMHVGSYKNEADYVADKKEALNKKTAGMGDEWAVKWYNNRAEMYEPKFTEIFSTFSRTDISSEATYTIIVNTIQTNVGHNVAGGMFIGSSKSAFMDCEIIVVKTREPTKKLAVITIDGSKGSTGNTTSSGVNDGGLRISQCYASAAKALAKFLK